MIPSGAMACTVRSAAVFPDPRLVLPEMSRIRTSAAIRTTYLARPLPRLHNLGPNDLGYRGTFGFKGT